ncbi:MAG: hypothetical protein A2Y36_08635 [Treponema sp. GWA1_62_8]|nr:MAG: hypothetical protein A2Y36_08635 [Treponema sp. GWA1_62_8]OHE64820.1 MAG: hypothetical protein A2001_04720 [Treponema sp. GWC1_61_84]
MRIRSKLLLGISTVVVLLLATMGFVLVSFSRSLTLRAGERLAISTVTAAYRVDAASKNLLLSKFGTAVVSRNWIASIENLDSLIKELDLSVISIGNGELNQKTANVRNAWKRISESFREGETLLAEIAGGPLGSRVQSEGALIVHAAASREALSPEEADAAYKLGRLIDYQQIVDQYMPPIIGGLEDVSFGIGEFSSAYQRRAELGAAVASVIAILFSSIFIFLFSASFARRIGDIESSMALVARRNLSRRVAVVSDDEIGSLAGHVNATLDVIREFLSGVRDAAGGVASLKDELASGASESAASLAQIAAHVSSVKSELDRLKRGIAEATVKIHAVEGAAVSAYQLADVQTNAAGRVTVSMEKMRGALDSVAALAEERRGRANSLAGLVADGAEKATRSNDSIRSIAGDVGRIEEVVGMIASVADSTNLLAMNAAIEAAHAGDAGRGFAVVADEIRKLSDSTAENAKAIGAVLRSIGDLVGAALSASEANFESFRGIEADAAQFAQAMDGIVGSMAELSLVSSAAVRDAGEMTAGSAEIRKNADTAKADALSAAALMRALDAASDQVVAAIAEIAAGSDELVASAESLNAQVSASRDRVKELDASIACFILDGDACEDPDTHPAASLPGR